MRYLLGLIFSLLLPLTASATGVLTPAANPPVPISVLSRSGIAFIKASSGTMGNNGAVSAMTALPRTFSQGAYLYLPAGAICAVCNASVGGGGIGNPSAVGWYWFVASSTTAGTVYNYTYSSETPILGTATALTETGPGAYAGVTSQVVSVTIPVIWNTLGLNGRIDLMYMWSNNTTAAQNKVMELYYGTTALTSRTETTSATMQSHAYIQNRGSLAINNAGHGTVTSGNAAGAALASYTTIDTSTTLNVNFRLTTATATDHIILESYLMEVRP